MSPYLERPCRTWQQAQADILAAKLERNRRDREAAMKRRNEANTPWDEPT